MVYIEQFHLLLSKKCIGTLVRKPCKENLGYCPGFFLSSQAPLLKRSLFSSHILPVIHKKGMSIVQHSMYTKSLIKVKEGSLLSCVFLKLTYLKKAKIINLPLLGQAKL